MTSKQQDEKHQKLLRALLQEPDNKKCFDCLNKGPVYACLNFNTFVCTQCSGIHREFNHRVKSISMAVFKPEEIKALQAGGNAEARKKWLAKWSPDDFPEPDPSDQAKVRQFMKLKYHDKKWVAGGDRDDRDQYRDRERDQYRGDQYRDRDRERDYPPRDSYPPRDPPREQPSRNPSNYNSNYNSNPTRQQQSRPIDNLPSPEPLSKILGNDLPPIQFNGKGSSSTPAAITPPKGSTSSVAPQQKQAGSLMDWDDAKKPTSSAANDLNDLFSVTPEQQQQYQQQYQQQQMMFQQQQQHQQYQMQQQQVLAQFQHMPQPQAPQGWFNPSTPQMAYPPQQQQQFPGAAPGGAWGGNPPAAAFPANMFVPSATPQHGGAPAQQQHSPFFQPPQQQQSHSPTPPFTGGVMQPQQQQQAQPQQFGQTGPPSNFAPPPQPAKPDIFAALSPLNAKPTLGGTAGSGGVPRPAGPPSASPTPSQGISSANPFDAMGFGGPALQPQQPAKPQQSTDLFGGFGSTSTLQPQSQQAPKPQQQQQPQQQQDLFGGGGFGGPPQPQTSQQPQKPQQQQQDLFGSFGSSPIQPSQPAQQQQRQPDLFGGGGGFGVSPSPAQQPQHSQHDLFGGGGGLQSGFGGGPSQTSHSPQQPPPQQVDLFGGGLGGFGGPSKSPTPLQQGQLQPQQQKSPQLPQGDLFSANMSMPPQRSSFAPPVSPTPQIQPQQSPQQANPFGIQPPPSAFSPFQPQQQQQQQPNPFGGAQHQQFSSQPTAAAQQGGDPFNPFSF